MNTKRPSKIEVIDTLKREILNRLLKHTTMPEGEDGCWLSTYKGTESDGGHIRMRVLGRSLFVHRVSHEIVNGHVDPLTNERPYVLHTCGKASCWKPDHLYAGTGAENYSDAVEHGTQVYASCGTVSGAARHRQLNEPTCDLCLGAEAEYREARRNARS